MHVVKASSKPGASNPAGVLHQPKVPGSKVSRAEFLKPSFSHVALSRKECRGAARARARLHWVLPHRRSSRAAAAAARPPSFTWSQQQQSAQQQLKRQALCTASASAHRCAASIASICTAMPIAAFDPCHTRLWSTSNATIATLAAAVTASHSAPPHNQCVHGHQCQWSPPIASLAAVTTTSHSSQAACKPHSPRRSPPAVSNQRGHQLLPPSPRHAPPAIASSSSLACGGALLVLSPGVFCAGVSIGVVGGSGVRSKNPLIKKTHSSTKAQ